MSRLNKLGPPGFDCEAKDLMRKKANDTSAQFPFPVSKKENRGEKVLQAYRSEGGEESKGRFDKGDNTSPLKRPPSGGIISHSAKEQKSGW